MTSWWYLNFEVTSYPWTNYLVTNSSHVTNVTCMVISKDIPGHLPVPLTPLPPATTVDSLLFMAGLPLQKRRRHPLISHLTPLVSPHSYLHQQKSCAARLYQWQNVKVAQRMGLSFLFCHYVCETVYSFFFFMWISTHHFQNLHEKWLWI